MKQQECEVCGGIAFRVWDEWETVILECVDCGHECLIWH